MVIPAPRRRQGLTFAAVDVETANEHRGSICAIGLAIVRDSKIVDRFSWLTRPPASLDWFEDFNVSIHGIYPDDVVDQPRATQLLREALDSMDGLPLIAHNAAFDVGAIRDAHDADGKPWPSLTYGCSLVMARRSLDLVSYRLPLVTEALGIPFTDHHDAGADAVAAAQIVLRLADQVSATSLADLIGKLHVCLGEVSADGWRGCHRTPKTGSYFAPPVLPEVATDANPSHPLYGHVMVFTGALALRREDAWARVAALGAVPERRVTKRTTRLVVGDGFRGDDPAAFTTGKAAKAVALRNSGQEIEVLTEDDLYALLVDTGVEGRRAVTAGR